MSAMLAERWVLELDRAVEYLRDNAMERASDDPARPQFEAASNRLASYALALRDLAEAGVSTERLAALIERGWRDAALTFTASRPARPA